MGEKGSSGGGTHGAGGTGGADAGQSVNLPLGYNCPTIQTDLPVVCDDSKGACVKLGDNGYATCTRNCTTQSDCPPTLRCTDAGTGHYCLQRCTTTGDCATLQSGGFCATTSTSSDGVCWPGQANTGELHFAAALAVKDVLWDDEQHGSWRMVPGTTVTTQIDIVNRGNVVINGTTTVASKSPDLTAQFTNTAGIQPTQYQLYPDTWGGSLPTSQNIVLTYRVDLAVAASAAWDKPLPFALVMTAADGTATEIAFAPAPRKPKADFTLNVSTPSLINSMYYVGFTATNVGYGGVKALVPTLDVVPTPSQLNPGTTADVSDGVYYPALLAIGGATVSFSAWPNQSATSTISDAASGTTWNLSVNYDFNGKTP